MKAGASLNKPYLNAAKNVRQILTEDGSLRSVKPEDNYIIVRGSDFNVEDADLLGVIKGKGTLEDLAQEDLSDSKYVIPDNKYPSDNSKKLSIFKLLALISSDRYTFKTGSQDSGYGDYLFITDKYSNHVFLISPQEELESYSTETREFNSLCSISYTYIVTRRKTTEGEVIPEGSKIVLDQETFNNENMANSEELAKYAKGIVYGQKLPAGLPIKRVIGPFSPAITAVQGQTLSNYIPIPLTDNVENDFLPTDPQQVENLLNLYVKANLISLKNINPNKPTRYNPGMTNSTSGYRGSRDKSQYISFFSKNNVNRNEKYKLNINDLVDFFEYFEGRIENKITNTKDKVRFLVYFYIQVYEMLLCGEYYDNVYYTNDQANPQEKNDDGSVLYGFVSRKIKEAITAYNVNSSNVIKDDVDNVLDNIVDFSSKLNQNNNATFDLEYIVPNIPVMYQLSPGQISELMNYGTRSELLKYAKDSNPEQNPVAKIFKDVDSMFDRASFDTSKRNRFIKLTKVFKRVNRHYYSAALNYIKSSLMKRANPTVLKSLVSMGLLGDDIKAKELSSLESLTNEASNNIEKLIFMMPGNIRSDYYRKKFDNKNFDYSTSIDSSYGFYDQNNLIRKLYGKYAKSIVNRIFELWNDLGSKLVDYEDENQNDENKQDYLYKTLKGNYAVNVIAVIRNCLHVAMVLESDSYSKFREIKDTELFEALVKNLAVFTKRISKNNTIKGINDLGKILKYFDSSSSDYFESETSFIGEGGLKSAAAKIKGILKYLKENAKKLNMSAEKIKQIKHAIFRIIFCESFYSFLNRAFFANLLTCAGFNLKEGNSDKDRIKKFDEVKIDGDKTPIENFMELATKYIKAFYNGSYADGDYLDLNVRDKRQSIGDNLRTILSNISKIEKKKQENMDVSKLGDKDEKEKKDKDEEDEDLNEEETDDEDEEEKKKKKEKEEKEKEEKKKEDEQKALSASQNFEVSNMNTFKHNNVKISEVNVDYKVENGVLKVIMSNFVKPAEHLEIFCYLIHDNKVDDNLKFDLRKTGEKTYEGEFKLPAGAKDLALHFYLWDKVANPQKGAIHQYFISDVSIPDLKPTEELKKISKPVAIKFKGKDQKEISIENNDMGLYRLTDGRYVFWVSNYQKYGFGSLQGIFGICMKENGDFGGAGRYTLAEDKSTNTLFMVIHEQIAKHFDSADHFTVHFYKNEQLTENYIGLLEVNLKEKVEENDKNDEEEKDENVKTDKKAKKEKDEDVEEEDEDEDDDDEEKSSKSDKKKKKKNKKNKKNKKSDEDEDEDETSEEDDDKKAALLKDDDDKKVDDIFDSDLDDDSFDDVLDLDDDLF